MVYTIDGQWPKLTTETCEIFIKNSHYTVDGETPLCGWHVAHVGEPFVLTDEISLDVCDLCLYVNWRRTSHSDILEHLPKCRFGINIWPEEESINVYCDIPTIFHEGIPEEEQIHWDFHIGYWIGVDPSDFVLA